MPKQILLIIIATKISPFYRKLESLSHELREHPYTGTGKPERLKEKRFDSIKENIITMTGYFCQGTL
jgi:Txe/YoeB family toxin of Txe-Axe toxin-antitoxin module